MRGDPCHPTPDHVAPTVGGVDEAGRGPLAGPVFAAAVVLAPGQVIAGVKDSKLLSARRRAELDDRIRDEALAWGLGCADVEEIDRLNILNATLLAMQRAVAALHKQPTEIHVDGNRAPRFSGFSGPVRAIVGGDRCCPAIAAASILAKVARDAAMRALHQEFPGYGFASHFGYPTAGHREALSRLGPCPAHRRSFRPVAAALAAGAAR
jgi:ribonuclease HII